VRFLPLRVPKVKLACHRYYKIEFGELVLMSCMTNILSLHQTRFEIAVRGAAGVAAFCSALVLASPIFAQNNQQYGTGFFHRYERPIRVLAFQPLPGFWESIDYIDASVGRIDRETEWVTGINADIWVFALRNISDADILPAVARQILLTEGYDGGGNITIALNVERDGEPSMMLMHFLFVDDLTPRPILQQGCLMAVFVYDELASPEVFDRGAAIARCDEGIF
jgi:hypothetical protein